MSRKRALAALVFVTAVAAGVRERPAPAIPAVPGVIAADLHVHAMPGDGALPVWEIQREAARRGLSAIAVTNHDDQLALRLARASGRLRPYPIVLAGQEVTSRDFHISAIGLRSVVDSRLPARQVVAAIHAQGGIAIAAHPLRRSWRVDDPDVLASLDGVEVLHPTILLRPQWAKEMFEFYDQVRQRSPRAAAVGSTDFHVATPLGLFRTYLLVEELSESGILAALRSGRAVAGGPPDRLVGAPEHITAVQQFRRRSERPTLFGDGSWLALAALAALVAMVTAKPQ